jgi:hypothetical protein
MDIQDVVTFPLPAQCMPVHRHRGGFDMQDGPSREINNLHGVCGRYPYIGSRDRFSQLDYRKCAIEGCHVCTPCNQTDSWRDILLTHGTFLIAMRNLYRL